MRVSFLKFEFLRLPSNCSINPYFQHVELLFKNSYFKKLAFVKLKLYIQLLCIQIRTKSVEYSQSSIDIVKPPHELKLMTNLQILFAKHFFLILQSQKKTIVIREIAWHWHSRQFTKPHCLVCSIGVLHSLSKIAKMCRSMSTHWWM